MSKQNIEDNLLYVAALMTTGIVEKMKDKFNLSYKEVLDLIKSHGGDKYIENRALMFTLKDNSLDECIDLILGKISVDDLS